MKGPGLMKKRDHGLSCSIGLVFLLLFFAIIPNTATAEPVRLALRGEDGRAFFHPGEKVTLTIQDIDRISFITVEGSANFSVDSWSKEPDGFSAVFPAPDFEGTYTLTVEGLQDEKTKRETIAFSVEAFELYVYPENNLLISNSTHSESTEISLELVDWKGDLISGEVNVSITRSSLNEDGDERDAGSLSLMVNGRSGFTLTPDKVTNSTLYHISASYMDYPPSECGVVVQAFPLFLEGERIVIEGAGNAVNGPFLKREPVRIDVSTTAQVLNITLTDIIDNKTINYSLENNRITFTPTKITIYSLQVTATEGNMSAETLMTIPVNDWPITINAARYSYVGEEFQAEVIRENGAFFSVRSLLFNEHAVPASTVLELIEEGSSRSPFYEKALLNIKGGTNLTFRLPPNMREGEYLLVVGLGSWDEGEVSYHGMAFSHVTFQRPPVYEDVVLSYPEKPTPNTPFQVSIKDREGNTLAGLTLEVDETFVLPDSPGAFTLSLPPGTHRIRVLSGAAVLLEENMVIPPEPEGNAAHEASSLLASIILFVLFISLVFKPE